MKIRRYQEARDRYEKKKNETVILDAYSGRYYDNGIAGKCSDCIGRSGTEPGKFTNSFRGTTGWWTAGSWRARDWRRNSG